METKTKKLNYQLLHIYQTNSPLLCTEQNFKRLFKASYAQAIIRFSLELQEMFCMDSVFNHPEKETEQRVKIKVLFASCFEEFLNEKDLFRETLKYLISGTFMAYNFAYGYKLYSLFKQEEQLKFDCKMLFLSRVEANLLSKYYEKNPTKKTLDYKGHRNLEQTLQTKLSRYKIFG